MFEPETVHDFRVRDNENGSCGTGSDNRIISVYWLKVKCGEGTFPAGNVCRQELLSDRHRLYGRGWHDIE